MKYSDTNVFGVIRTVQAFTPYMIKAQKGRIINVGSGAAYGAAPWQAAYNSSKAAMHSYNHSLRMELKGFNVQVSVIVAGPMKTVMSGKIEVVEEADLKLPEGSFYNPVWRKVKEDFAVMATKLNSPVAASVAQEIYKGAVQVNSPVSDISCLSKSKS